jgi:hypothetical protein
MFATSISPSASGMDLTTVINATLQHEQCARLKLCFISSEMSTAAFMMESLSVTESSLHLNLDSFSWINDANRSRRDFFSLIDFMASGDDADFSMFFAIIL